MKKLKTKIESAKAMPMDDMIVLMGRRSNSTSFFIVRDPFSSYNFLASEISL